MQSLTDRILFIWNYSLFDKKDGDILCPDEYNSLNHEILLIERIGSGSVNGEAYKSCIPYDENTYKCKSNNLLLSTKKIPLTNIQKSSFNLYKDHEMIMLNTDVFVELTSMKLCKFILSNSTTICPNLPLYYYYFMCNNCDYKNPEIIQKKQNDINNINKQFYNYNDILQFLQIQNTDVIDDTLVETIKSLIDIKTIQRMHNNSLSNSCILLTNEYANEGDLKSWLDKKNRSEREWHVMYFQVFAGLYTLQKHFDLTHNDLHWGNILVQKISPGGFLYYKINETYFKIPNIGYLFTLWDFGYARIPNDNFNIHFANTNILPAKMQAKESYFYNDKTMYLKDYMQIVTATEWNITTNNKVTPPNIIRFYEKVKLCFKNGITLHYMFDKLFSDFIFTPSPQEEIITLYTIDDDNIPEVPDKYKWLLNKNSNYKKTYKVDYIFADIILELYKTRGQNSIENYLNELIPNSQPEPRPTRDQEALDTSMEDSNE